MADITELHQVRHEQQDLSSDDLTLEADRGESIEILARSVSGANDEDDIEESVDETTLRHFFGGQERETLFQGEFLPFENMDVMGMLRRMGFDLPTIKVPSGTQYVLDNLNDNGTGHVLYRDYNSERFSRGDDGAPEGRRRAVVLTGQEETTVSQNTQEINAVATSATTGGLPNWPYEEDVPSNREYDVAMIAVRGEEDPAGSGAFTLDAFRLNHDGNDFLARSSATVDNAFAFYPDADPVTRLPFVFMDYATGEPRPLTFEAGDDLTVELEGTETTNNADVSVSLIASIVAVERRL